MSFMLRSTPVVSTSENSFKRLISYHIAVGFMVIVAIILQAALGLRPLFYALGQISLAFIFSVAIILAKNLIEKKPLFIYRDYMNSITYGLLAALLLPTESPFYVIISLIVMIHLIELFFKKLFRKNIMHPVLLGLLIVHLLFREYLPISETMSNIFQEESLNFGRIRFLFGAYEGLTLGTSAFIVLGFLWIYLSVSKIIQFRMSMWFIANLLWIVLVLGLFSEASIWSLFTKLILGYSMFVLVYFVAEPTSTPETREMMWFYPFIAAMLTAWFRLNFDIVEAALYAIVFAQFLSWILEQLQQRTSRLRSKLMLTSIFILWGLFLLYQFI
ncbi:MAG: RnfABCDGE type electron transport complex subunit D [Candidatus Izemoplasmataceae bacterium]